MEFTVKRTVTREDYINFNLAMAQREARIKYHLLYVLICVFLICMQSFVAKYPPQLMIAANSIMGFLMVLFLLSIVSLLRLPKKLAARLDAGEGAQHLGESTMTLRDDQFEDEDAQERTVASYAVIQRITAYRNLLLVMNGPGTGWIIPKEAFDSPAQMEEFIAILTKKTGLSFSKADRKTLFGEG